MKKLVEKVGRKGWLSGIKYFGGFFSTILIHRALRMILACCIGITILIAMP